jgi:hypothetical protein
MFAHVCPFAVRRRPIQGAWLAALADGGCGMSKAALQEALDTKLKIKACRQTQPRALFL